MDSNVEDDFEEEEVNPLGVVMIKINSLGVALDNSASKVYFRLDEKDPVLMQVVRNIIDRFPGKWEVMAVKDGTVYGTGLSMDLKGYKSLLSAYMSRRNQTLA